MFDELLNTSRAAIVGADTYLFLPENRLARAAVTRLNPANRSEFSGSMTSIHGPLGVGKSYLARWTLREILKRHPSLKFVYASAQRLCEAMQLADEQQMLAEFLEHCRSLDVLVCDDLHLIERSPQLQMSLLMLIETLEVETTQILMTSTKPVGELRSLDQKLVSRCHGGLCILLPNPGLESRILLFQHWFQELRLPILKPYVAAAKLLAERLPISTRDLRSVVEDLCCLQRHRSVPIDVAYLERWLSKNFRSPELSFDTILNQVASEFGVNPQELRSRSRQQVLVVPRQCAMFLARELTGSPLEQIGNYFDRSHTTVSHSLANLKNTLPTIPTLRQQVQQLLNRLKQLPREDCA